MKKLKKKHIDIPLLPLRDIVVFPGMITPLFVGRPKSINALEEVMTKDKTIFLVSQKDAETDDPTPKDIYNIGCIGKVIQLLKLADGTIKALIEAQGKAKIVKYIKDSNYYSVQAELMDKEKVKKSAKKDALVMHPGPMNRGIEIDTNLADDINRSVIREQVELGVAVRMACLKIFCKKN